MRVLGSNFDVPSGEVAILAFCFLLAIVVLQRHDRYCNVAGRMPEKYQDANDGRRKKFLRSSVLPLKALHPRVGLASGTGNRGD
jgi:hypothetical protein